MRLLFCCTDTNAEPWLAGLRRALPEATIELWAPGAAPAEAAVVWAPPQAFFDEQPGLGAVFNIGAGVDALLARRIAPSTLIVRLDDAGMAVQMAEYVCHAVIRQFREFDVYEGETRAARWAFRKPRRREEFVVGLLGLGVLGTRVAQTLRGFEFPVQGWSRSPKRIEAGAGGRGDIATFTGTEGLHAMLAQSRVLVNLLPLTDDTRNILNRDTLSRLPTGGYLINVARGAHLVDEDLIALLDSGHLAGATLDVFRHEPLPPEHPFWRHPRITITPHTSARTLRDQSIAQIAGKIRAMNRGEPVVGVVNRLRGY